MAGAVRIRHGASILIPAALLLGACGITSSEPASLGASPSAIARAEGPVSESDVMFLQLMLAHHEQAVVMTDLAEQRAERADIKSLATAIEAVQSDEAALMQDWLDAWGEPSDVGHSAEAHAAHAAHGGLPATGPAELEALEQSDDADFDAHFLNLFIAHQHNAVEMARAQEADGTNPEVTDLANRVARTRSDQVAQMLSMLNS